MDAQEKKEELRKKIQYLKDVENLSFRQIESKTGIARKKCAKLYAGDIQPPTPRGSRLDEVRDLIVYWFQEHPKLKAIQIHERLQDRGFAMSYSSVKLYTREFRKKKKKCYFPLTFLPGEEGQVDWFFYRHPLLGKLAGFAFILSYSRMLFAHLFERHSFEFFIEGHLKAFQMLGGLPRALRFDNLSSVVLKREPLTYNPSFLDFARHYGFEIRLCNPASGNEKGRVERTIRSLRETFFNTVDSHQSLKALNQALYEWVKKKNQTLHRATNRIPIEMEQEETLKPLPLFPWVNMAVHAPRRPTKTGLIIFDTNRYSIPDYLVGQPLSVHAFVDHLKIYDSKGKKVATHRRCFERGKTLLNPLHRSFGKISPKAKRQRIYSVIRNLNPLCEQFLNQNEATAENPYDTAYHIFKALKHHARETIYSAMREALLRKMPRLKFLQTRLEGEPVATEENVTPQNPSLLDLDYKPRNLEDYEDDPK